VVAVAALAGCVTGSQRVRNRGHRHEYHEHGSGMFGGGGADTETATATPTDSESTTATDSAGTTATATESSSSGSKPRFDGYLDGVKNYDGVVDESGSSSVTVTVGADNGGQPYGFGPAAVNVSTGTQVTWEWNGEGGAHNVIDEDGAFESELVSEEGHTFSYTFDSAGTYTYYCQPHKALGMKGVVVVE
jgi:halocyanin-like protein